MLVKLEAIKRITILIYFLVNPGLTYSANTQVILQKAQAQDHAWDTAPSLDSSNNLIFFRLATLLQHWPNTRYPLGELLLYSIRFAGRHSDHNHRPVCRPRNYFYWYNIVSWPSQPKYTLYT